MKTVNATIFLNARRDTNKKETNALWKAAPLVTPSKARNA